MCTLVHNHNYSYILSLPSADEQDEYLGEMLDASSSDHRGLMIAFKEKREEIEREASPAALPQGIAKVYKKADFTDGDDVSAKAKGKANKENK